MAALEPTHSLTRVRTISNDESEFEKVTEIRKTSGAKANHCIETIDALNHKISGLTSELETFAGTHDSKLVAEQFEVSESLLDVSPEADPATLVEQLAAHDLERRQIQKFAGIYSTFASLSKDGKEKLPAGVLKRSANKKSKKKYGTQSDITSSKKPMLVELHSFPGFDGNLPTPLPLSLTAIGMMKLIVNIQKDLMRKPSLKREFYKFFCNSNRCQTIFQDIFWWYFCNKYQANPWAQGKLFNRIAQNYTTHVITWIGSKHQRILFERLPDLMCQSVYAVFCQAFPESYKQFDETFKDTLVNVVYQWMVGTKPAPRSWRSWDFEKIEPLKMRKREQMEESSARAKLMQFDLSFLSEESLNRRRQSKAPALGSARRRRPSRLGEHPTPKAVNLPSTIEEDTKCDNLPNGESVRENNVNSKENRQRKTSLVKSGSPRRCSLQGTVGRQISSAPVETTTTPIQETAPVPDKERDKFAKEFKSCIAGKGPVFSKVVFDVYGRSPLVEHFMQSRGLSRESGCIVYVQRTEIEKLPSLSMPTYREIIKNSLSMSRKLATRFRRCQEENNSERSRQLAKWRDIQTDYNRRCASVLENPKEVRKLSDLLRRQEDSDDDDFRSLTLSLAVSEAMGYNNEY